MTADESATTAPPRRRRPVIVTVAVVLVYLSAIANVTLGILVLLSRYGAARTDVLPVSLLGAAVILFGLLLLAVASGLARGSRLSRALATVYLGVLIVLSLLTVLGTDGWDAGSLVDLGVEAFILIALWAPPGSRHFARTSPDPDAAA